jgi:hypothetical protein
MRWMQDGLPLLGERTTVRWLGSSAVEMTIRDGKDPFASATLVIFLEPRDMPWMWALARSRGRRDILIVRGVLREAPAIEFEALDPLSWSGREARSRVPEAWLTSEVDAPGALVLHHADAAALAQADRMLKQAGHAGMSVKRLSVRRSEPNFQLHVILPHTEQAARDFFEAVHSLAHRALA